MRAVKAIIHLDNFRHNIEKAREKAGARTGLCAPVKADAYGHGAVPVARAALEAGASHLAVATVSEGAELRQAGIKAPVFLFSQALPGEMEEIAALDLIPLVGDREAAEVLAKAGRRLEVHLKVDTGMGRMGARPENAAELAAFIVSQKSLKLGGVATHLSVSDSLEPADIAYTKGQLSRFRGAVDSIKAAGLDPGLIHAANSGALCFHEDAYFDLVRPGIFLYGYSPAAGIPEGLDAEPVMELRGAVVFIKKVFKGEDISYGRTWTAPEDTYIGTLPVGYADGLPRLLSNRHSVYIKGRAYPQVGRICMDQCMINLGPETDVKRWDEAIIFGPGAVTAADMAAKIGTISYEITCNINKRVPRVYI
ncbi:alanine racemase [Leadbettera azotonutricia]|uniref:Alanine racemase n=1 Tax=Leadbettera azotonutricia (strain ATCC BAA-888 / DSM 13862 / ZAS-9) TaxID=545695 RepID=F5YFB4_LEAAZ|nr:alanine racemase [Leadbettera azotonutricia]AEF82443.1 alanine racemase [Leadbettera azotonutricia ZAS-9]